MGSSESTDSGILSPNLSCVCHGGNNTWHLLKHVLSPGKFCGSVARENTSQVLTPNFLSGYPDVREERCMLGRHWWVWAAPRSASTCCLGWDGHLTWLLKAINTCLTCSCDIIVFLKFPNYVYDLTRENIWNKTISENWYFQFFPWLELTESYWITFIWIAKQSWEVSL